LRKLTGLKEKLATVTLDANQIAHGVAAKAERITQQWRPPQRLKVLPSPKAPKRAR
jgi:hypothetical protein